MSTSPPLIKKKLNSLWTYCFILVLYFFCISGLKAQLKVNNGKLYDNSGNQLIIRGANVLTLFWDATGWKSDTDASGDWSKTGDYTFSQLTQTGANTARIMWRRSNGYITVPAIALDYTIANCIKNNMVPMIMMYDVTGPASVADFNKEIDYLVSPDVASVLKKYQTNIIVNLANEWEVPNSATGTGVASDADIRNAYGPAIIRMRNAGINCPLVIDAMAGYASEESTMEDNASYLKSQDVKDNLIFSIHCYDPINTTKGSQASMKAVMDWAISNSICFIWGEFNYYGSGGNVDWQYLIQYAQTTGTGWLEWAWWDTTDKFSLAFNKQFRAWDNDVNWTKGVSLDNPNSIQQTAIKSLALPQQDLSASIGVSSGTLPPNPVTINFPNDALVFAIDPAVDVNRQGASLIQTAYVGGKNSQLWNLKPDGNGYYKIVNVASGKVMEVAGGSTAKLANIQQGTDYGRNFQLWSIQSDGAGKFKIRSKHADLSPIIESDQTTDGLPIETYSYTGQTFTILGRGGPNVPVTSVSVSPTLASITINGTQQLSASLSPLDASNQSVTWSSSDNTVATVSSIGVVTGVKTGTATITVTTADGSKTATVAITVTPDVNIVDFDDIVPTVQAVVAGKVQFFSPTGGTVSIVSNPQINAINGSANVGKYDKPASNYSLFGFFLPIKQPLSGYNQLQFQLYGDGLTQVYVKLLNAAGNVINEGTFAVTSNNNWVTIAFNFPAATNDSVATIDIFPNPNEATAKTFYVDNIVLRNNSISTDTQAPTAPTALASSNITSTSFTLTWTASTDNVGVTGYDVYNGSSKVNSSDVTTTSLTVTGLTAATSYSFTVRAKDAAGNVSLTSAALSVTTSSTADTQAPTAPTTLASSNITSTSFTLTWVASTDNVSVTGYDVYNGSSKVNSSDVTTTSFPVTGLMAATTYSFTVKAKDAAGNVSNASAALSVTTTSVVSTSGSLVYDDTLQNGWTVSSNSIYNLSNTTQVKNGSSSISIEFGAYGSLDFIHSPSFSSSGYNNLTFWGYGGIGAANKVQFFFYNASGTQIGVKQFILTAGQWVLYTINLSEVGNPASISKIALQDYAGIYGSPQPAFYIDDLSFSGSASANNIQAPSGPTSLTSSNITQTSFTLSWTPSADNVGVTGYDVYNGSTKVNSGNITSTSYQITGLSGATTYSFTVKAKDTYGNMSPSSNALSVTTASASTGSYVYDDALENSWTVSGAAAYNLNATAQVKNGSKAISVINNAYTSIDFSHSSNFSTVGYTNITFWGYGGTGDSKVQVIFYGSTGSETGRKQFIITAGAWNQYTVNLSELGNPATLSKIVFQDYAGIYGSSQPVFYIDDLVFNTTGGARMATNVKVLKTNNEAVSSKLTLAPNPAENEVTVYFETLQGSTSFISITDMNGRLVHSSTTVGNTSLINVSDLKRGIYILRVNNNKGSMVEKLIVQ